MLAGLSAWPFPASSAEANGAGLPSYDAGLRRTALPPGCQPEMPVRIRPDKPAFGFSEDELRLLAARYEAGTELWRVPLEHFSAVDWNYPAKVVSDDAVRPSASAGKETAKKQSVNASVGPTVNTGGSVRLASRTFEETLPICGTSII